MIHRKRRWSNEHCCPRDVCKSRASRIRNRNCQKRCNDQARCQDRSPNTASFVISSDNGPHLVPVCEATIPVREGYLLRRIGVRYQLFLYISGNCDLTPVSLCAFTPPLMTRLKRSRRHLFDQNESVTFFFSAAPATIWSLAPLTCLYRSSLGRDIRPQSPKRHLDSSDLTTKPD